MCRDKLAVLVIENTMPKKPETAVAGRRVIVKAAMIFMAELSALVACAMKVFVSLSCWVIKLKTCVLLVASRLHKAIEEVSQDS